MPQEPTEKPFALLAEYDNVDSVMLAAVKVRDAGYTVWDVHTPFPVHGMDKAMGIKPTILPLITLMHGIAGLVGGLFLVIWINGWTMPGIFASFQGYEFLISGKPMISLPANIPIVFETTVLLAAMGTVMGMFALNKLPMLYHPLHRSPRFRRVTNDRFFIVIETTDPKFDTTGTEALLKETGASAIENVMEDTQDQ
ncbi:MAG: DUF3341 domain-containing protein [Phycisphaerales bacterium]|nr:DUF3341 domain-containing protein [Phycisphaerales bacterium]